jgi:hypothetical protein
MKVVAATTGMLQPAQCCEWVSMESRRFLQTIEIRNAQQSSNKQCAHDHTLEYRHLQSPDGCRCEEKSAEVDHETDHLDKDPACELVKWLT